MTIEKRIAGLWCHEVADLLEPWVAGRLSNDERAAVETHVAGCAHCASFGDRYARLIAHVRAAAATEAPGEEDAIARLMRKARQQP
jgi:anti-sigma factor RsiW